MRSRNSQVKELLKILWVITQGVLKKASNMGKDSLYSQMGRNMSDNT